MYSDNKQIRDVADAAAKIMYGQQPVTEKLHPNQQQLDVVDDEKIDGKDFAKLRAKKEVKKEEVEKIDEEIDTSKYYDTITFDDKLLNSAAEFLTASTEVKTKKGQSVMLEEGAEQILEYETDKNGKFVHNAKAGKYGGSEKPQDPFAGVRGPGQKDLAKIEAEKKKKKFSEMVNLYQEKGLKSLSEMLVKEEPDNEQFTKELEDAKAKSEGKKKNTEIAKGQPIAPISVKEEVEVIEEKHMTDDEMNKREDIVKSMKKGMAGFKDRYGDRAKNVMYATATKQAMK
jgi:hypothetical protein